MADKEQSGRRFKGICTISFTPRSCRLVVVVLIGSLALVVIGVVAGLGPTLAHGNHVEHEAGTIVAIGPGKTSSY